MRDWLDFMLVDGVELASGYDDDEMSSRDMVQESTGCFGSIVYFVTAVLAVFLIR